jgi:hypothetical protein
VNQALAILASPACSWLSLTPKLFTHTSTTMGILLAKLWNLFGNEGNNLLVNLMLL